MLEVMMIIVLPLLILVLSLALLWFWAFAGAAISAIIVGVFFHIFCSTFHGYGNPTGQNQAITWRQALKADVVVTLASLLIFSAIVCLKGLFF